MVSSSNQRETRPRKEQEKDMDEMMAAVLTIAMLTLSVSLALGIEWLCLEGAFRLISGAPSRAPAQSSELKARHPGSRAPALWR